MSRLLALCFLSIFLLTCQSNTDTGYTTTGTIEAYQLDIRASAPGKIIRANIPEGQKVVKEQLLAIIDTTEFHLQKKQLLTKLDGLPAQLESLDNKAQQLRIRLEHLNKQVDRLEKLVVAEGVSQEKLDEVRTERNVIQTQLADIPIRRRSVRNQEQQLREQVALLDYKIDESVISSPADGTILQRYVEIGERIQPGHLLTTIGLTDTVWTMMYLPEPALARVNLGQNIPVRPDGAGEALTGTVEWIAPEAEFTPKTVYTEDTRTSLTYGIRVSIPNPNGLLKIGMPVVLELPPETE